MDQHVTAVLPPQEKAERSPSAAIAALSLGLFVIAVVLIAVALPRSSHPGGPLSSPWWLMVPLFAAGEYFVASLRLGRSSLAISFGNIPLVMGFCLLDPVGFLLANLLGSGFTLLKHRRQRGLKLFFNLGLWSFEAGLALTVYGLLSGGAEPSSLRSILAAYATIIVTDRLTNLAVTTVIYLHERRLDRDSLREALTWGLLIAICNASVGLLFVVLLKRQVVAVPLLAVVLGLLLLAYRAYEQLHDTHQQLERQHGFAQSLMRAHDTKSIVNEVLNRTRELLHAEVAELHLGETIYRSTAPGSGLTTSSISTAYWLDRLRDGGSVLLAPGTKDSYERALLADAGVHEAAAAGVSNGAGADGVLVLMEPMGDAGSFTKADLRALETFAHQASIALDNGRLVDQLREAADREVEAMHDPLTGLPNRRQFAQAVEGALDNATHNQDTQNHDTLTHHAQNQDKQDQDTQDQDTQNQDTTVGVLLVDLDRFKDVNYALGHSVGDELLVAVAHRLRANLPEEVLVARLDGDAFAVLVPQGATNASLAVMVDGVHEALSEILQVGDVSLHLQASIGSAVSPQDGQDAEALLQRADIAMCRAKKEQTGYEPFLAALDLSSSERLALYAELRRAVFDGLLQVHFQPCVDPLSGRVLSVEALARWHHPTLGDIGPDEFIPLAEGSGLIGPLTMLVLERSLSELSRLRSQGLFFKMAVNLSPRVLLDPDLPSRVESMLLSAGVPADALILEVTENAIMAHPSKALIVLEELHSVGVILSIDDFGTGHSSLAYLRNLPVGEIKIDQSFIRNLSLGLDDGVIVRSTIDLAHELGLSVVAEGVEDANTLELLGTWGCDAAQGFFMSRPLTDERLDTWLQNRADTSETTCSTIADSSLRAS